MNEVQTGGNSKDTTAAPCQSSRWCTSRDPTWTSSSNWRSQSPLALRATAIELIFVVDGSPDNSLQVLRSQQRENPKIVIVDLSRNFGHHQAAWCGLHTARGDLVFIIDCDLEVSPAVLKPFADTLTQSGADVVYGYQESRRGGFASKYLGDAFWRIFNLLSTTRVPHNICTERLMSRRYVDTLLTLGDRNLFLAGMYFWAGFEQVGVKITKQSRKGRPVYTVFRRVQTHGARNQHILEPAVADVALGRADDSVGLRRLRYCLACPKDLRPRRNPKWVHDPRVADEPLDRNYHDEPRRDWTVHLAHIQPDAEPSRLPDTIGIP